MTLPALSTPGELRSAYEGVATASTYVAERFASELHRLLHDRQVATINRLMTRLRPRRTLEIAPGPGRLTQDVRPTGQLVCVEYNEGMIATGRTACGSEPAWVRGDGFRLPFRGGFDLVYSFRFVRHFRRDDRLRLYAELHRLLNPGGCFVLDAVNERVSRPLREAQPDEYPIYDKCYRLEELQAELARAGLEPIEVQPVQRFFACQHRSQVLLGPRSRWANRLVIRGLELVPWRNSLEWIVTCRRA
jgi:SAM-dependent methyltransferase